MYKIIPFALVFLFSACSSSTEKQPEATGGQGTEKQEQTLPKGEEIYKASEGFDATQLFEGKLDRIREEADGSFYIQLSGAKGMLGVVIDEALDEAYVGKELIVQYQERIDTALIGVKLKEETIEEALAASTISKNFQEQSLNTMKNAEFVFEAEYKSAEEFVVAPNIYTKVFVKGSKEPFVGSASVDLDNPRYQGKTVTLYGRAQRKNRIQTIWLRG